jgi:hypothetical protein
LALAAPVQAREHKKEVAVPTGDVEQRVHRVEPRTPHVEPRTPHVDPRPHRVEPRTPHVDPRAHRVEPRAPHVDPRTPAVDPRTPHVKRPSPGRPVVVKRLPHGHFEVHKGRDKYYYHHGHYFRRSNFGFITIMPPVGLVVPILPPGYTTVVVAGSPYYYYEGIYYSQASNGFVVVTPPPAAVLPPPRPAPVSPYGAISVTAASLNVRSGPGRQYNVITVIQQGDIYPVQANAPGWIYIQLPDGRFGWVEQIYTAPAASAPSG